MNIFVDEPTRPESHAPRAWKVTNHRPRWADESLLASANGPNGVAVGVECLSRYISSDRHYGLY